MTTGSSSAEFGNAQSGVISVQTKTGGSNYTGSFGYESDEPFSKNTSLGFNRFQGSFGGPITRNLTFFLSGALEGNKSIGTGVDAQKSPIFVQAGIDTVVAVPDAVGSPTSDTTLVPVYNYAAYRGDCDEFSGSADPGIASNYGVDCQGGRTPYSARSTYQLNGKLNYTFGTGSRIAFTTLASQFQGRTFSQNRDLTNRVLTYQNLYNPEALVAFRQWSRVYTLNWTQNLTKSTERALALETYISYQQDRTLQGPMTTEAEASTRDPFGGFLVGPIDFLFDFGNFPLNQELVDNYRENIAGSRRSPLDLEDRVQYATSDVFRNNAYALYNRGSAGADMQFYDNGIGSPLATRLIMYKENRWVGKANLDWQFDRYNRIKVGGEFTRYDIGNYSHQLDDQIFSDVFLEKPIRWNAFAEDRLDLGDVVLVAGLRYDWYHTRAKRPVGFPVITTHPDYDPNNPDAYFNNPDLFREDQSHNYLSPHVQVSFPVTERTNFRLSYAHQVQAPDFGVVLQGINSDINLTNTNNVYGADVDFGKSITFEFGVRHAFNDDMVLDLAAYNKDNLSNAANRLISLPDPTTNVNGNVRLAHQRRLRQHPRYRRAAGPPVRQPVQRHPVLQLHGCQEHRVRSGYLHRLRIPGVECRFRGQPAAAAGGAADRLQPAPHPGRGSLTHLPQRLEPGLDGGLDLRERRRLCHLPVCQRYAVHRLLAGLNRPGRGVGRQLRSGIPRGVEPEPPARVQEPQLAAHQGLRPGRTGRDGLP